MPLLRDSRSVHAPVLHHSSILFLPVKKAQCLPKGTASGPATRRLVLVDFVLRFLRARKEQTREGGHEKKEHTQDWRH